MAMVSVFGVQYEDPRGDPRFSVSFDRTRIESIAASFPGSDGRPAKMTEHIIEIPTGAVPELKAGAISNITYGGMHLSAADLFNLANSDAAGIRITSTSRLNS